MCLTKKMTKNLKQINNKKKPMFNLSLSDVLIGENIESAFVSLCYLVSPCSSNYHEFVDFVKIQRLYEARIMLNANLRNHLILCVIY